MSFQTPITVKEAIDNIHRKKYLLPSIQRELVWEPQQIEKLFDSLMRDYPVGSFLFWYVDKRNTPQYQFYEFMRTYHARDSRHNPKAHVSNDDDIIAILDGQQRLTSLFIGLCGSYAYKEAKKRWDNDSAFPTRKLHLNLLKGFSASDYVDDEEPDDEGTKLDLAYDFYFLTDEEANEMNDGDHYWFKVADILQFKEQYQVNEYLFKHSLHQLPGDRPLFASRTLFKLFSVVHKDKVINYFLEKSEELDKVLNIFVRVNSAGTILSYSDLLLSIASASWKEKDAREEINGFVDEINRTGGAFNFDKDFVLKTCLVLCDFTDIAFKVDNFNRNNMLLIEQRWNEIKDALRLTVSLVSAFGYNRDTLASSNALIPIAYYLLKKGSPNNFVNSSRFQEDRTLIREWLIASLLKRAFSGSPDVVLRPLRQILAQHEEMFPLKQIIEEFRGKPKSITFGLDEIENLFNYDYGSRYTFSTLAALYPSLDFKNRFHVDHVHPRSSFQKRRLQKRGVTDDKIGFFIDEFDYLANLQLLEGTQNLEKSKTDFNDWVFKTYDDPQARRDFMSKNYIPDVDLHLENFEEFISARRQLMATAFTKLLRV